MAAIVLSAGAYVLTGVAPPSANAALPAPDLASWITYSDDGTIWIAHPDGADRRVVTPRPTEVSADGQRAFDISPDLTSDAQKIAFLRCSQAVQRFGATLSGPVCEVWTVRTDGSDLQHVPMRATKDRWTGSVSWSPDGTRLAVGSRLPEGGGGVITVVSATGDGERDVAFGAAPDWGPDGDHVAFSDDTGIAVVSIASGAVARVASGGALPTWSPDGQRIAFRRSGDGGTAEAIVHPDGTGLRLLRGVVAGGPAAWSPDSRFIGLVNLGQSGLVATSYYDLAGTEVARIDGFGVSGWGNPAGVTACRTAQWTTRSDGRVVSLGSARFYGDLAGSHLNKPLAGMAAAPNANGYWLLGGDGGVFTFGPGAGFFGSTGDLKLNAPVLAMTPTNDGAGYWLVAGDGGIFTFGDAPFYGSTGAMKLNEPVVALAATPTGAGYWLVASDGGVFSFGDAAFFGSTGNLRLAQPIVAMVPTASGRGYWLVAKDGGVFTFGDAPYPGSAAEPGLRSPVIAVAASPNGGKGFTMATADGQLVAFGDAEWCGSPRGAIVGVATA